jgi:uncharacterized RDD family membrane protein YckC
MADQIDRMVLAGIPARAVAYLIDLFLVSLVTLALWLAVDRIPGMQPAPIEAPGVGQDAVTLGRLVVSNLLLGVYFVVLWSGGRRTVGMHLLRIRVVRTADAGPVTVGTAIIRWAVFALPALGLDLLVRARPDLFGSSLALLGVALFGWPVVLCASVLIDRGRQGFHDRAARTVVVSAV